MNDRGGFAVDWLQKIRDPQNQKCSYEGDWEEQYKRKSMVPEEAAELIKSGDRVAFTVGHEAQAIGLAIAARKNELKGVKVFVPTPARDFGWYDVGWEDSFEITIGGFNPTNLGREMMSRGGAEFFIQVGGGFREVPADVVLTEVSPPDNHGFCSFGSSLWNKKEQVKAAKLTMAEVNENLIRTAGDNFIHVSDIDVFVQHPTGGERRPDRSGPKPTPEAKTIAEYVRGLIRDGDTLELGTGTVTEWLPRLGVFDDRHALGLHTEMLSRGLVKLVREGVITGECKTLHPYKVVSTSAGGSREDMDFINMNPMFELYSVYYTHHIGVIAAHDNMVAINQALSIDLTGQIASESIGPQVWSGPGGQAVWPIGAIMSKGGRGITIVPSTAKSGTISRIVPYLEPGTIVTVPRHWADIVVTEYGIAYLRNRTQRQRAEALTAIAHPDFRSELKKAAQRTH